MACLGAAVAAAAGDAAAAARSLDAAEAAAAASAAALETALASVGAGPAPQQARPCGEECTADHICECASCMTPIVDPETLRQSVLLLHLESRKYTSFPTPLLTVEQCVELRSTAGG